MEKKDPNDNCKKVNRELKSLNELLRKEKQTDH